MRILHLSSDDTTGGAARCAYRLHLGLRRLSLDSRMLVRRRRSDDPEVLKFHREDDPLSRVRRRSRSLRIRRDRARYRATIDPDIEAFSDDRSPLGGAIAGQLQEADIIHLHWISGFVDLQRLLAGLPSAARVVWTLHDMNAFTGGCHYAGSCDGFVNQCGECPQLGSADARDLSRGIWQRKDRAFGSLTPDRLQIVTPSRWLEGEVRRSSLLGPRFEVRRIPYGVDTDELAPRDRAAARATLGVPAEKKVILFAAHSIANRRKGFDLLARALAGLDDLDDLFLVSLGGGHPPATGALPHRHLGYVGDERLLSLVYSAADVFVLPSRQDNLPATGLEALACGTPVVGFAVGGVPDLVRPGVTGALADEVDAGALGATLRDILSHEDRLAELRRRCRAVALDEYTLERQARDYRALYERCHESVQPAG